MAAATPAVATTAAVIAPAAATTAVAAHPATTGAPAGPTVETARVMRARRGVVGEAAARALGLARPCAAAAGRLDMCACVRVWTA